MFYQDMEQLKKCLLCRGFSKHQKLLDSMTHKHIGSTLIGDK